jgi:hypothetical protein
MTTITFAVAVRPLIIVRSVDERNLRSIEQMFALDKDFITAQISTALEVTTMCYEVGF